jgi:hypothetical protein
MSRTKVNVGSIVNPLAGLQKGLDNAGSLYLKYLDGEDRKVTQAEADRRWELTNDRAQVAADQRATQFEGEQIATEFQRNYTPEFGKLGGQGIDTPALKAFSEAASDPIRDLMSSYGLKTDKSDGISLSELEANPKILGQFNQDMKNLTVKVSEGMGRLEPTKGSAYSQVYSDVMEKTGDAKQAKAMADNYSEPYTTKKEMVTDERAGVKEVNTELKQRVDNLKYTRKVFKEQFKDALAVSKQFDKKISDKGDKTTKSDINEYINKVLPDESWSLDWDRGETISAVNSVAETTIRNPDGTKSKPTPKEILRALQNSFTLGSWDNDMNFETADELSVIIEDMRKSPKKYNTSARKTLEGMQAKINDPKLLKAITGMKNVKSRNTSELLSDMGREAMGSYNVPARELVPEVDTMSDVGKLVAPQVASQVTTSVPRPRVQEEPVQSDKDVYTDMVDYASLGSKEATELAINAVNSGDKRMVEIAMQVLAPIRPDLVKLYFGRLYQ